MLGKLGIKKELPEKNYRDTIESIFCGSLLIYTMYNMTKSYGNNFTCVEIVISPEYGVCRIKCDQVCEKRS